MCSHEDIFHNFPEDDQVVATGTKQSQLNIVTAMDSSTVITNEEEVKFLPKSIDESRSTGQVTWTLYWKYFRSGSNPFILVVLLSTSILTQFLFTLCDYWLNMWTSSEEWSEQAAGANFEINLNEERHNRTSASTLEFNVTFDGDQIIPFVVGTTLQRSDYLSIYSLIVVLFSLLAIIRSLIFFKVCMDSSVGLHNSSFRGIMRAPMRFFEVNPIGRVLNRFSKDLGCIDDALPLCFFDASVIFLNVIGIMVLIGYVNTILLLPGTVLGVIFLYLRTYYLNTARSVKRLEGIAKSPVFSHLSSTLQGLTTLRAYGVESQFIEDFDHHQDLHSAAWFLFIASSRWFGIRLDILSAIFISIVTFSFMLTSGGGSGPEVGLAISSVLVLSGMFQWGVRQSAEVSNQMVSVERILDYSMLQPEASLQSTPGNEPPETWPKFGKIVFKKVSLHYGDKLKPVLDNLSMVINSCEKIGIVGRTGAGKSTILTTLFRIVEPSGEIWIDDINILNLGLHELRSKISIIPQDPVLFTGTLRQNLDPFEQFPDEKLWSVLKKVELFDSIEPSTGLEMQIAEGGASLSLGERQLICLGRAILRQNKILVLDEATANIDSETDALLQATIREMFQDCTVLTIAHRLNTVMDSDKILVLEAGTVKEFDSPYLLLLNEGSSLYSLAKVTGGVTMDSLIETARKAYEKRLHKP